MSEAAAAASAPSAQSPSSGQLSSSQNQAGLNNNSQDLFDGTPGEVIDSEADVYTPKTVKTKSQSESNKKTQLTQKQAEKIAEEIDFEDLGKYSKEDIKKIVKHRLDMDRGAYAKMQEAAQIRKEAEGYKQTIQQQLGRYLKENPRELYKSAGLDFDEVAYNELSNKVQELQMTPEQRELSKLKQERQQITAYLEQQEQQKQEQQKQVEQQKFQQEVAVHQQKLEQDFIKAYDQTGLPPNQRFARWMANDLADYYEAGVDVPIEHVAQRAYEEFRSDFVEIASKMNEQQLRKFMPKELMQKISKLIATEFGNSTEFQNRIKPKPSEAPTFEKKPKYLSLSDVEEMRKRGEI